MGRVLERVEDVEHTELLFGNMAYISVEDVLEKLQKN
jgi:hypothetical protein